MISAFATTASTIVPLAILSPLAARCSCTCSNSGRCLVRIIGGQAGRWRVGWADAVTRMSAPGSRSIRRIPAGAVVIMDGIIRETGPFGWLSSGANPAASHQLRVFPLRTRPFDAGRSSPTARRRASPPRRPTSRRASGSDPRGYWWCRKCRCSSVRQRACRARWSCRR